MWIARLSNGDTKTEKDFEAEEKRYEHLPLDMVVSLQVPFNGNYVTVTRANDTQVLIQQKLQRTTSSSDKLPEGHPLKSNPHVETVIFCIMNKEGYAIGWAMNFEDNTIRPFADNVNKMRLNFELFGIENLDDIVEALPDIKIYTMRRDEGDFSIR